MNQTMKNVMEATIFVDHASQFTFVHNQVSLNVGETLKAKSAL